MDEKLWDEWFDKQYELNKRIDRAVSGLSVDRDAKFRIALWSSVIEHAAEELRSDLPI